MAGDYEKAISIVEAINKIRNGDFLLPAIQRKFVWSSHQICVLFDSLMRGYPINSFMLWEIKDPDIKNNYKFYKFIEGYCQRFHEENPHAPTDATIKDFKAVIDGQQRLTSLFIGLCNTYAYKQPRVWWPNTQDDELLPPRKLYIDLLNPLDSEDDDALMHYNFKFLTEKQYESSLTNKGDVHWYCLHQIMQLPQVETATKVLREIVLPYLTDNNLRDSEFAEETLCQLYDVIRCQKPIHYFNETSQEIDHVLDVFIRTNSGGTKLEFSDLLMSIAVANWDGDFRKEVDSLVKEVNQSSEMGFYLGRDWVLKTCLMLTESDVKFQVKNFKAEQVSEIQKQWSAIKKCIKETFVAVRRFGINSPSLTSKNAIIPICYYLYKKQINGQPLYLLINNLAREQKQRDAISKWLFMVLLKGIFGGQADTILTGMRDIIRNNLDLPIFPLEAIVDKYKGTNKDLRFDDEYLDRLLDIQHGEGACRVLLHLLFPEMNPTETFDIDHLHPASIFREKLNQYEFLRCDEALMSFYAKKSHWNSIPNLHLLNHSQNKSKNDAPLAQWIDRDDLSFDRQSLMLDSDTSLDFDQFKTFYIQRRAALKARLEARVVMTQVLSVDEIEDDLDDEVAEINDEVY